MSDFLKEKAQPFIYKLLNPVILLLVKLGITPNIITAVGFILNIIAAIVFIWGAQQDRNDLSVISLGGVIILFAGLFDMMDGRLARVGKMESRFGAMFDSVLDRYSELVMFLGICYYLVAQSYFLSSLFAFIAMIGSMMVSYVRARAEGLGIECRTGLMQRPERILLISISAILCGVVEDITGEFRYTFPNSDLPIFENITLFTFPLFIMAVLTNWTAILRMRESKKALDQLDHQKQNLHR